MNTTNWIVVVTTLVLCGGICTAEPGADKEARQPDKRIELGGKATMHSMAVSADGQTAWVHASVVKKAGEPASNVLLTIDLKRGVITQEAPGWKSSWHIFERMLAVADGKSVLVFRDQSGTDEHRGIRQFDVQTSKVVREFPFAPSSTFGAQPALSADGKTLYTWDETKVDRKWNAELIAFDLASGRETARTKLAPSPDEEDIECVRLFATAQGVVITSASAVRIWNPPAKSLRTIAQAKEFKVFKTGCWIEPPPVWVSDQRVYGVVEEEDRGVVRLRGWDLKSGAQRVNLKSPDGDLVHRVFATADDRLLLCGTDSGSVRVYDLAKERWVDELATAAFGKSYAWPVGWLNVSADGRTLIANHARKASDDGLIPWRSEDEVMVVFDLGRYRQGE